MNGISVDEKTNIRRIMLTMVDTPNWTESFMWRKDGVTSWAPFAESSAVIGICLAYDWIYNCLTDSERASVRDAVNIKGMYYINMFIAEHPYVKTMNQGLAFSAGEVFGALLLNDPVMIEKSKNDLKEVIGNYFYSDGDTNEGAGYWLYSSVQASLGIEALTRYNPNWTGELQTDGFKKTVEFLFYGSSMASDIPLVQENFNEGRYGGQTNTYMVAPYFTSEFQDGTSKQIWEKTANLYENFGPSVFDWGSQVFGLIFLDDSVAADSQTMSKYKNLSGSGYVYTRSGWEFGKDIMLALVGGKWPGGHSHQDKNSIILEGYGTRFLVDRGGTAYSDPALVDYQHAKSHNTITLNGEDQIYKPLGNAATIEREFTSPLFDFFTSEAKDAYNSNSVTKMDSFKRNIIYARPDLFIVLDEVAPHASSTIAWNMHTPQSRSVNGNIITFTDTNASLDMGILLPAADNYELSGESLIKGDGGNVNLFESKIHTSLPMSDEKFMLAMRLRKTGDSGFTITNVDHDVNEINLPEGKYITAYGNTTAQNVDTDAKFIMMYQSSLDGNISNIGLMKGTNLAYAGVQLVSSDVECELSLEWNSNNTAVGKIKAYGSGTVTIRSPFDGSSTQSYVFAAAGEQVISNILSEVVFAKSSQKVQVGWKQQLALSGRLYDGSAADLSSAVITYTSSNPSIVSVNSGGEIAGLSAGTADITCNVTMSGITRMAAVKVTVTSEANGNLISNGGFENSYNDWNVTNMNGSVISSDTVEKHGGSASIKTSVNPSKNDGALYTQFVSRQFDVKENALYDVSFWYKVNASTATGATNKNRLIGKILWYDMDGNRIGGSSNVIIDHSLDAPQSTQWLSATAGITAPEDAAKASISVRFVTDIKNVADIWLDDVEVKKTNILLNGSFESDTDANGVADNWTSVANGAYDSTLFTRDISDALDGNYSQKYSYASCSQNNSYLEFHTDYFDVDVSRSYTARAKEQFLGKILAQTLFVIWYNSSNQEVGARAYLQNEQNVYNSSQKSGWITKELTGVTPPAGAVKARVVCRTLSWTGDASGTVWYDDIYMGR